jgi:hypothetical protein
MNLRSKQGLEHQHAFVFSHAKEPRPCLHNRKLNKWPPAIPKLEGRKDLVWSTDARLLLAQMRKDDIYRRMLFRCSGPSFPPRSPLMNNAPELVD